MRNTLFKLKNIHWNLYLSLIAMGVGPMISTTIRFYFLNSLPSVHHINIASQIQWFSLMLEIIQEGVVLPLFYIIGKTLTDRKLTSIKLKSCYVFSAIIYASLILLCIPNIERILLFMGNKTLIAECVAYIKLESIALLFSLLLQISIVALILSNKVRHIYMLFVAITLLPILCDTLFVSSYILPLNLGTIGVGYSSIISNLLLFILSFYLVNKDTRVIKAPLMFGLNKEWLKLGWLAATESTIRNIAYALVIIRILNSIEQQGLYWQVNSFIWVWLLLPILKLGELIKQDSGTNGNDAKRRISSYYFITTLILMLWLVAIPLFPFYFSVVTSVNSSKEATDLLLYLLCFYAFFAFSNIWSSYLQGFGQFNKVLLISIAINSIYYPAAYCYTLHNGVDLYGVCAIFGFSFVISGALNFLLYKFQTPQYVSSTTVSL